MKLLQVIINFFTYSRRLFYNTSKEVVEQHGKPLYVFQHRLEIAAYLLYVFRFAYIMLSMSDPGTFRPIAWDTFFTNLFAYLSTDRDLLFGGIFLMLFVSCVLIEHSVYFSRVDTDTWQILYDGVVKGGDIFSETRLSHAVQLDNYNRRLKEVKGGRLLFLPKLFQDCFSQLITKTEMWFKANGYNRKKIKSSQWKYVPQASVELRAKMFIFVEVVEVVYCIVVWFLSKKSFFE